MANQTVFVTCVRDVKPCGVFATYDLAVDHCEGDCWARHDQNADYDIFPLEVIECFGNA